MTKAKSDAFDLLADKLIKGDLITPAMAADAWRTAAKAEKEKESAMSGPAILPAEECWLCGRIFHEGTGVRFELGFIDRVSKLEILFCQSCTDELFPPKKKETTNATKES